MVQLSHPYIITGKTIALTIQTFVGELKSLLFNMVSQLVITFLPRSKCLLVSWWQSPSAVIFECNSFLLKSRSLQIKLTWTFTGLISFNLALLRGKVG